MSGALLGGALVTAILVTGCSSSDEEPAARSDRSEQPTRTEQVVTQMTMATEQAIQTTGEVAAQVVEDVTVAVDEATGGPEGRQQMRDEAGVALEEAIKAVSNSAEDAQVKVQAALAAMEPRVQELSAEVEELGDLAQRSTQDGLRRLEAQYNDMRERAPEWQAQGSEYWERAQTQMHTTLRRLEHDISSIKLEEGLTPVTDKPLGVPDRDRPVTDEPTQPDATPAPTRPRR